MTLEQQLQQDPPPEHLDAVDVELWSLTLPGPRPWRPPLVVRFTPGAGPTIEYLRWEAAGGLPSYVRADILRSILADH